MKDNPCKAIVRHEKIKNMSWLMTPPNELVVGGCNKCGCDSFYVIHTNSANDYHEMDCTECNEVVEMHLGSVDYEFMKEKGDWYFEEQCQWFTFDEYVLLIELTKMTEASKWMKLELIKYELE